MAPSPSKRFTDLYGPGAIHDAAQRYYPKKFVDRLGAIFEASTGSFNVVSYGATGDGTTDDTAAIQAAIDAAELALNATVFFPQGEYKITSPITINRPLHLLGAGVAGGGGAFTNWSNNAATMLRYHGTLDSSAAVLTFRPSPDTDKMYAPSVRAMKIVGSNGAAALAGVGIHFIDMNSILVDEVVVERCRVAGIKIEATETTTSGIVDVSFGYYYYNWGNQVAEAEKDSAGVLLYAIGDSGGGADITHFNAQFLSGSVYDGYILDVQGSVDGSRIERLHDSVVSGGTGGGFRLAANTGTGGDPRRIHFGTVTGRGHVIGAGCFASCDNWQLDGAGDLPDADDIVITAGGVFMHTAMRNGGPSSGTIQSFNVRWYGAIGDGMTDDTLAIQACIDACEAAGGGVAFFPPGDYAISNTLVVNGPVRIVGSAVGWAANQASSNVPSVTTITKIPGSGPEICIRFESATSANWLGGCGVEDMKFVLNSISGAIELNGVEYGIFRNLHAGAGLGANFGHIIRMRNTRFCTFDTIALQGTGVIKCIHLDGETAGNGFATASITQNVFYHCRLTYGATGGSGAEGGLIIEGNCDNNNFYHVHCLNSGSTKPATSGTYGVLFKDGTGSAPRANVFHYLVGYVGSESTAIGNRIVHMTAEAGGVTVAAGSVIHYTVEDWVTHGMYQTPFLKTLDRVHLDPAHFTPNSAGAPAVGLFNSLWPSLAFTDAAVEGAGINLSGRQSWADGNIVGCILHHGHASGSTSENVNLVFSYGQCTPAEGAQEAHTASHTDSVSLAIGNTANQVQRDTITFATPFPYAITDATEGLISFKIERDGTGGSGTDDLTQDWHLLSVTLLWEGPPPSPASAGPWQYGGRGV